MTTEPLLSGMGTGTSGFEAKNSNIYVKLETQSWEGIYTVLDTKIQNNKAPDILELDAAGRHYVVLFGEFSQRGREAERLIAALLESRRVSSR